MPDLIQIDGSLGEGGGQIVRTAVSLSAITGRAVQIFNVRAGRSKPGLQPQHLAAVHAAAQICQARIPGARLGSMAFAFEPQSAVRAGEYRFDIGTAGATPLVAQTVLVPLALAPGDSRVVITGGTHVPHAPTADYLEAVYVPTLRRIGIGASCQITAAGFYPLGRGQIELSIAGGGTPAPLELTGRPKIRAARALIVTSGLPKHVAERAAATIQREIKTRELQVTAEHREMPSPGIGASVLLTALGQGVQAGFSAIGARGKPMETVAHQACAELESWLRSGAACDEHLADQLVLPLSLAPAQSRWTTPVVSEHLRTVLHVAQQFLPIEFSIGEPENGPAMVQMKGATL